jgi:hypothetical protein
MSTPRRRLIRPPASPATSILEYEPRLKRLRTRLTKERAALGRWTRRLKRAFHAVEKQQRCVCRLEREIANQEEKGHAAGER